MNSLTGWSAEQNPPIAEIAVYTSVSIVIPTYQECENIPHILKRIDALRRDRDLRLEVLFVDDNSDDGSVQAVADAGFDWARMIVRTEDPGLSPAVIDGFRAAQYPIIVCMDCDLSHPPEKIPQMVQALSSGQQLVVGSRYVPGGSTDDDWGVLRWLNSRIATILARPLTRICDPMSGFFALRRADFDAAEDLNPVGYKIGLELIVKCGFEKIGEVPIRFTDRIHGESKLTLKEQLKYIQHIRRLYIHRFANAMHLMQFLVVGGLGVVVNLTVLTLLLFIGLAEPICLAGGIGVSVVTNFMLNRRFTFSYARDGRMFRQFLGYLGASSVGLLVNYTVALFMNNSVLPETPVSLQLAAMAGIISGMFFNFIGNRYFVFRKRYVRK